MSLERLRGVRHVIVVASGKGGVGKTTVAVNLAFALARLGARAGLFDADLYGPNVPLMLGLRRRRPANAAVPIARAGHEPYITPVERYGLQVMSIGFLVADADAVLPDPRFAGRLVVQTLRDVAWRDLDYLLLDLPPGTGDPQQSLLAQIAIDGVVLVTTPQDLSLLDAGRSLAAFRNAGIPVLGVVENMSYLDCPHCGERIDIFHRTPRDWAIEAEAPLLGRIPIGPAISRGIDTGHPLMEGSAESAEAAVFLEIARAVSTRLAEERDS